MFPFEHRVACFRFLLVRKTKRTNNRPKKSRWKPGFTIFQYKRQHLSDLDSDQDSCIMLQLYNTQHKALLLLGDFVCYLIKQLPLSTRFLSTTPVFTIYCRRLERLRELEAPWLSNCSKVPPLKKLISDFSKTMCSVIRSSTGCFL